MKGNRRVDNKTYRNELKFLCTEQDLYLIENKIRHICKPDTHAGAEGTYSVKSLYFDTYDDRCYYENRVGADNRKKYRVRIYNNNPDVIKLECKYSRHGKKAKDSCTITRQQCEALAGGSYVRKAFPQVSFGCRNGTGENGRDTQWLLHRFLLERELELLVPKIIVDYMRTPYIHVAGNVRITFDRAIRSASRSAHFLTQDAAFRNILPADIHILEVKYDEFIPAAILELVATGRQMYRTSFSKYALCREYSIR